MTLVDKTEGALRVDRSACKARKRSSDCRGPSFLNVIVDNGNADPEDLWLFAGADGDSDEEVTVISKDVDMFDILTNLMNAFPSKGQARKNWKHGDRIPDGWSEFKIGKFHHHLCIWNPTEARGQDKVPEVQTEETGDLHPGVL